MALTPVANDLCTLPEVLDRRAKEAPEALAFAMEGERLSYAALRNAAERLGAGLLLRGVERGERVALLLPAGLDVVRIFFAVQRVGAVPCVFDPGVPAATSGRRIGSIRPHLVVVADATAVAELASQGLVAVTIADLSASAGALPPTAGDADDVAFLQSTSGTSGEARAAVILQRNVMASLRAARELLDPGPSDVLVGWVPPWHDLGLLRFLLGPVYLGLPCHLVPPAIRTIPQWFSTITAVRGTITGAPDFAYLLASRLVDPRAVELSSLRCATNGGEPVRASTIEAFERRFHLHGVIRPGYGLAEATLGVTSVRAGEPLRSDPRGNVSTGRPLQAVEVRIESGGEDAGEILVRGPGVFSGYFDAPDASAETLRGGWLHTGDIGRLDERGELVVLGRRRAMLKRGGAALAPRELEETAQSVEGVRIAAAIGLPGTPTSMTEEIVVVVEAEGNVPGLSERVAEAVERAIGFAPDRVVVQPPRTIPRTANGKIRHAMLRDQLSQPPGGAGQPAGGADQPTEVQTR